MRKSDFVTLSCPSCGGKLQITENLEQFACGYCGTEHLVRRGGGAIFLSPLTETLEGIQSGVDRTSLELTIQRLKNEINDLERETRRIRMVLVEDHAGLFETKWGMSKYELENLTLDELDEMHKFFSNDPNRVWSFLQPNEKKAHIKIRELLWRVPTLHSSLIQKESELEALMREIGS